MIDINRFCSQDTGRESIKYPFSIGNMTYATNGHIAIRVSRLADIPEREDAPRPDKIPEFNMEPQEWFQVPNVGSIHVEPCKYCGGLGKYIVCPECYGEGEVELETTFNYYDEQECKTCNGVGCISESRFDSMSEKRRGLNKIKLTCRDCDGSGEFYEHKCCMVGGVNFSDLYLSWLHELPNCEIGPLGETVPARFRFDGGDGLIMPRRAD